MANFDDVRRGDFTRGLIGSTIAPSLAASPAPAPAPSDTPRPDPAIDRFFARAKLAWRARVDPPFVAYTITESYYWHDAFQKHQWNATLRTKDERLALTRIPDPPGTRTDAFTVLDPPIVANDAFGFVEPAKRADGTILPAPPASRVAGRLNEIARTEAFVRDYLMENVGIETLFGDLVQHLILTPRREPHKYRLRDIWISVADGHTAQLSVEGLFEGAPYDTSRWLVQYAIAGGQPYVKRIANVEDLNFGGQIVRFLGFTCSEYSFPPSVPDSTFTT